MIRKNGFMLITAFVVILTDQLSKFLIMSYFQLNQSLPIIKGFLHLTYITNTGSAFGLFKGFNLFFILLSLIVIIAIAYNLKSIKQSEKMLRFSTGLLLGGTIGNLVDRIFLGAVVDFLDFRVWPVFNLADTAITISVVLLTVIFWKK